MTSNVLIGFEADIQGANIGSANTISLTDGRRDERDDGA